MDISSKRCGMPAFDTPGAQCFSTQTTLCQVEVDDRTFIFYMCRDHRDTWEIMIGRISLARMIGNGTIKGEWNDTINIR